ACQPDTEAEPPGGEPLARRASTHGEPRQRRSQGAEHCLIMVLVTERLQPHMSQPRRHALPAQALLGRPILVTRARAQAADLAEALITLDAEVVAAPVIRIQPLADLEPLRAALAA